MGDDGIRRAHTRGLRVFVGMFVIASLFLGLQAHASHEQDICPVDPTGDPVEPFALASFAYVPWDPCGTYDWQVDPPYEGPYFDSDAEADAAEPPPPAPATPTPPTWRNLYDWPSGHGYAGLHDGTSSPDDYGRQAALGGQHGIWLWPTGGSARSYDTGEWAEWTYTAPGTTRLSSAQLSLAYRNKLLAHHCVAVGFRDGSGMIVTGREWCTPVAPPDSQRNVDVPLVDPAADPTSKVFFFRIRVDCGGAATCSKNIPALGPLATGGYARLLRIDMTLVDDDVPDVVPSGELFELSGAYIDGRQTYSVTVSASDAGAGIDRAWLEHVGSGEISQANAPCDPTHQTAELDNRICPANFSFSAQVDTNPFPEGTNVFVAKAVDVAGNVDDRSSWPVIIDRAAPGAASGFALEAYGASLALARIGWVDGQDPDLPDGTPGSGTQSTEARYHVNGNVWSDWETTDEPGLLVESFPGDTVTVEARSVDGVGNVSPAASGSITVSNIGGELFPFSSTEEDEDTERALSPADEAQAIQIAQTDPSVIALIGSRATEARDVIAWTKPDGSRFGAQLTLAWPDPIGIDGSFPWVAWSADGQSYSEGSNVLTIENATELEIIVDLLRGRVVSINPGDEAVVVASSATGAPASAEEASGIGPSTVPPEAGLPGGANLRLIRREIAPWVGNDKWWNYDFQNTSIAPYDKLRARFNVDWPVTVIFWGEVDVVTAKDMWNRGRARFFRLFATPMHARLWDRLDPDQPPEHRLSGRPVWDTDRGSYLGRAGLGFCQSRHKKWHYRAYAPAPERGGSNRLYNVAFGFYVIATTHLDYNETCDDEWHGLSDSAAAKLAAQVPQHTRRVFVTDPVLEGCQEIEDPWHVEDARTRERRQNTLNLFNRDNRGRIGKLVYKNDGFATMIYVPRLSHPEC